MILLKMFIQVLIKFEAVNRWFAQQPVLAELPPECTRGRYCNFMRLKPISKDLRKKLYNRKKRRGYNPDRRRGEDDPDLDQGEIIVLVSLDFHSCDARK